MHLLPGHRVAALFLLGVFAVCGAIVVGLLVSAPSVRAQDDALARVGASLTVGSVSPGLEQANAGQVISFAPSVPPTANDLSVATDEDTALSITLSASDADTNPASLTYAVVTQPGHGTLSGTAPNLTYTPATNFNDADSFTFTASDNVGTSAPATVSIEVRPVNDAPVAVNDTYTLLASSNIFIPAAAGLFANDTDAEGDELSQAYAIPDGISAQIGGDGSINFNTTVSGTYVINYAVQDTSFARSNNATATIIVEANPVAQDQSVLTDVDVPLPITLTASGTEGLPVTFAIVTGPRVGTLSAIDGAAVTYTPDFSVRGSDSFTFTATVGNRTSAPATISIRIRVIFQPPTANDDAYTVVNDGRGTVTTFGPPGLLGNDVGDGVRTDVQSGSVVLPPPESVGVSIATNGGISITPVPGVYGTFTARYRALNFFSGLQSNEATITITITAPASPSASPSASARPSPSTSPRTGRIRWIAGPQPGATYTTATLPAAPTCEGIDFSFPVTQCRVYGYETAPGRYTLTARARDTQGNTIVDTRTYIVVAGGSATTTRTPTSTPTRPPTNVPTATPAPTRPPRMPLPTTAPTSQPTEVPSPTRPPRP